MTVWEKYRPTVLRETGRLDNRGAPYTREICTYFAVEEHGRRYVVGGDQFGATYLVLACACGEDHKFQRQTVVWHTPEDA